MKEQSRNKGAHTRYLPDGPFSTFPSLLSISFLKLCSLPDMYQYFLSRLSFCFAAIQFKSHNPWTARRISPRIALMPATQEFAEEAYPFPFLFTPYMVFYRTRKARFRMAVSDVSDPVCLPMRPATLTTASMRTVFYSGRRKTLALTRLLSQSRHNLQ